MSLGAHSFGVFHHLLFATIGFTGGLLIWHLHTEMYKVQDCLAFTGVMFKSV